LLPENAFVSYLPGGTLAYAAKLVDASGNVIGDGSLPSWLHFDASTETFTGTPTETDTGKLNIEIIATDSSGFSALDIFSLTVNLNVLGTNLADSLTGSSGNDMLNGGLDADTMSGGVGNDTYIVDNLGDIVIETSTITTEIDSVNSFISYTLPANVENLTLMQEGETIDATGNAQNNELTGNLATNRLIGDTGNDTLNGGLGKDVLTGGIGEDVFIFNTTPSKTEIDQITDFNPPDDTIQLENAIFTKLTTGILNSANFKIGVAAGDNNDFIVYNKTTGALYYDDNGNGAGHAVQIALIGTTVHPILTAADFFVV
jgi:Ca2+-binding RTX toxin-like protein